MQTKSPIAFHTPIYLHRSMTFIYRQLTGVAERHPTIVLTEDLQNRDLFPFSPIYFQPKKRGDHFTHQIYRWTTGRYIGLGMRQERAWASVLRARGSRLIYSNFGVGGMQVLRLSQSLGLPLLVCFQGFDASRLLNYRRYVKTLAALFGYAHVIVVSQEMGQRLLRFGAVSERMHYLPTGIPVEDFPVAARSPLQKKTQAGETITFLQVSRFTEKKGHLVTLRAFHEFLPSYPNSTLIFAGEGELMDAARKLSAELGLDERVQFVGAVTQQQVQELLPRADVFVHHSITARDGDQEGTPNAILEAMSTGLPVISSYHAGIPEVITDGENGLLVNEHDVSAYAGKMRALLDDDSTIGKRAARSVRESLDIRQQNEKLSQLIEAIIAAQSGSSRHA